MAESTSELNVTHDVLAALDMYTGLCGSEETSIEEVVIESHRTLVLTLSNGDEYELKVRQRR